MRFAPPICLLVLLVSVSPAMAAPAAKTRTSTCTTSVQPEGRAARFEGDMRTMPGARRLQIRFTLQARTDEEPGWVKVGAPGFGSWNTSVAGIARFVYVKTVANLLAPADYRTVVHFRWLGPSGQKLAGARRVSRVCRQPDLRPDLTVDRLTREPGGYAVAVENDGRSDAGAFSVTLAFGGRIHELGRAGRLAAGARTTVRGTAPDCAPGEMLTVRVVPAAGFEEVDDHGNELLVPCP